MLNPPLITSYSVLMGNVKHAVDGVLGAGAWAFLSVMLFNVWRGGSFTAVFLLAGLNAIPTELFEYAQLESRSAWQRFRAVTLPLLAPYMALAVFLSFTTAFADLGNVWMLTGGRLIFPVVGTHPHRPAGQNGPPAPGAPWAAPPLPPPAPGPGGVRPRPAPSSGLARVPAGPLRELRGAADDPLHPPLPGDRAPRARRQPRGARPDLLDDGAPVLRLDPLGVLPAPPARDRGIGARRGRHAGPGVPARRPADEPQRARRGRALHAGDGRQRLHARVDLPARSGEADGRRRPRRHGREPRGAGGGGGREPRGDPGGRRLRALRADLRPRAHGRDAGGRLAVGPRASA